MTTSFAFYKVSFVLIFFITINFSATAQFKIGEWNHIGEAVNFKGTLFFAASTDSTGVELWKTDGTKSGTFLVKDINPGKDGSSISDLFVHQDLIFFNANDGFHGSEIWYSDGTSEGTELFLDFNEFEDDTRIGSWFDFKGTLLFHATGWDSRGYYKIDIDSRKINCILPDCSKLSGKLFIFNDNLYNFNSYNSISKLDLASGSFNKIYTAGNLDKSWSQIFEYKEISENFFGGIITDIAHYSDEENNLDNLNSDRIKDLLGSNLKKVIDI